MAGGADLYALLGLTSGATPAEIRSAFRRLALQHHPDANPGDPAAETRFKLIHNAYAILSDPDARSSYDRLRHPSSASMAPTSWRTRAGGRGPALTNLPDATAVIEEVLAHLNVVLWDVDDLMRDRTKLDTVVDQKPVRDHLKSILEFLDRWVLSPAGFPDYFYQARRLGDRADREVRFAAGAREHGPFVSLEDYYRDIRKRTDRLTGRIRLVDLGQPLQGTRVRLIDAIIEAHNYSMHHLAALQDGLAANRHTIPPFRHSRPCFNVDSADGLTRGHDNRTG